MWFQNIVDKAKRLMSGGRDRGAPNAVKLVKIPSPTGPYKRTPEQEKARVKVSRATRRRVGRSHRGQAHGFPVSMRHGRLMVRLKWWPEIGTGQVITHDPRTGLVKVAFPFLGAHRVDGKWKGTRAGVRVYHVSELRAA